MKQIAIVLILALTILSKHSVASDLIYAANSGLGLVQIVDMTTHAVVGSVAVSRPYAIGAKPDGTKVYTTSRTAGSSNSVIIPIDTKSRAISGPSIPVGKGSVTVSFSPDGSRAYVPNSSNDDSTISIIDTLTDTYAGSF